MCNVVGTPFAFPFLFFFFKSSEKIPLSLEFMNSVTLARRI